MTVWLPTADVQMPFLKNGGQPFGSATQSKMETDADTSGYYLDRIMQANGGDADGADDDEEWIETDDTHDTDSDADAGEGKGDEDASAGSGGSDDDLECDFDELEVNGERQSGQYGGGISILTFTQFRLRCLEHNGLSQTAKEHLTWRLDKEEGFSDWTIVVRSEGGPIEPTEYNVHRHMLATGPRKSGYFETMLLSSGQYQEASNSTSTIELPSDAVSAFPTFLDYFYAPFPEARTVITQENWMQLRHLADYFVVSELSNAVLQFIESDMNNLERTEIYLKMAVEEGNEALIAHAATVCITDILHIEENSSLVYSMPPAFFWHVMVYSSQFLTEEFRTDSLQRDKAAKKIARLICSYLGRHGNELGLPYFLGIFDQIVFLMPRNCHNAVSIVILFLDLFKEYNWEITWFPRRAEIAGVDLPGQTGQETFEAFCVENICEYSTQDNMTNLRVAKIMERVPDYIAKELFIMASRKIRDSKRENAV